MAHEATQSASRVDVVRALRQAAITGLIAFGLLLPLIGFNTVQNIRNELILETRWPLLAAFVAIVAGGRVLQALPLAPWPQRRAPPRAASPPAAAPRAPDAHRLAYRARALDGPVRARLRGRLSGGRALAHG